MPKFDHLIQVFDRESGYYSLKIVPIYYPSCWGHVCLAAGTYEDCVERGREFVRDVMRSAIASGDLTHVETRWGSNLADFMHEHCLDERV